MFKKFLFLFSILFLILFFILIFSKNNFTPAQSSRDKIKVLVSILPQKQIAELIGGDNVEVTVLIPYGFSPATYEPSIDDMKIVALADVYLRIGHINFEKAYLDSFQSVNQEMEIIDTSVKNQLRFLESHHHDDSSIDLESAHKDEAEIDPHVWLSPQMVAQQAEIIAEVFSQILPEKKGEFYQNLHQLQLELESVDEQLRVAFDLIEGKTILVYHPAFGYLADEYGFTQEYIQIEGKDPTVSQLQSIIREAQADDIHTIFVQKQFSTQAAEAISENINGRVVEIDPLDPDYLSNIIKLATQLSK